MQHRFFAGTVEPLGPREIGVIASTPQLGRDGLIVEPSGIETRAYLRNPVVLFSHDPERIVGATNALAVRDGNLLARIEFAPEGVSPVADQCASLAKSGYLRGVSIGFNPLETQPVDPKDRRAGTRVVRAELLEISMVAIGADVGSGVVERAAPHVGKVAFAALRAIPRAAVERAVSQAPRRRDGMIMSHAGHVYALLEARRRDDEEQFGRAARLRDLDRLRERGRRLGIS